MSVKHGLICENKCMVEGVTKEEFDAKVSGSMDDIIMRSVLASGVELKTDFTNHFKDRTETELPYVETILGTDFTSMYSGCTKLTKLQQPLGILDTRQGTNFSYMFKGCTSLQTIPDLDTSQGTNFSQMFRGCTALTTIPDLDTSQGTNFSQMFRGCKAIQTVPDLDTSQGTDFTDMFEGCTALTTIPDLDTSQGTSLNSMFENCTSLQTIPDLDTSQASELWAIFRNCTALTTIPALDTSKCTRFEQTFQGCSALQTIPALDVRKATNTVQGVTNMFDGCTNLTTFTENPLLGDTVPWQFSIDVDFSSCPLDKDSILQVFYGLKYVTGKTITISSTTNGYLTEEDKVLATSKGWTVSVA